MLKLERWACFGCVEVYCTRSFRVSLSFITAWEFFEDFLGVRMHLELFSCFSKFRICLLVLMVGILASAFVTSNTNVVFLLKFSFLSACYLPWGRLLTLILNICVLQVIDSKPPVETPFEKLVAELKVKNIHLFHRDHNARCLPPQILHNRCFQFLLGITFVPTDWQNLGVKQGALWSLWK